MAEKKEATNVNNTILPKNKAAGMGEFYQSDEPVSKYLFDNADKILDTLGNIMSRDDSNTEEQLEEDSKKVAEKLAENVSKIRESYKKNPGKFELMLQSTDDDFKPIFASLLGKPEAAKARTDSLLENISKRNTMAEEIKKSLLDQYQISQGNFNIATAQAAAEKMVDKVKPSREGLDQLTRQGPTQIDPFDIPDRDKAILAETISTTIANVFNSIGPLFSEDPQLAAAARATTTPSSAEILSRTASMLATDVQETEALNRKVELMNIELMEKYKGDVVAAKQELDRRMDLSERTYNEAKRQEVSNIINRYDRYKKLGMMLKEANLKTREQISQMEQNVEMFNVDKEFRTKIFNTEARNKFKLYQQKRADRLNMMRMKARHAARKANVPQPDLAERVLAIATHLKVPETTLTNIVNSASDILSSVPEIARNPQVQTHINTLSEETARAVKSALQNGEITNEEYSIFMDNYMTLAGTGRMLASLTPENIKILAQNRFQLQGNNIIGPNIEEADIINSDIAPLVGKAMIFNLGGRAMSYQDIRDKLPAEDRSAISKKGEFDQILNVLTIQTDKDDGWF